jgi:hypothetical protein
MLKCTVVSEGNKERKRKYCQALENGGLPLRQSLRILEIEILDFYPEVGGGLSVLENLSDQAESVRILDRYFFFCHT